MLLMNGLAALLARAASEMTMRIAPPTLPPNRPRCILLYDTVWVAALRDYLYSSKLLYRAEAITQTQNETPTTNVSDVTLVCTPLAHACFRCRFGLCESFTTGCNIYYIHMDVEPTFIFHEMNSSYKRHRNSQYRNSFFALTPIEILR